MEKKEVNNSDHASTPVFKDLAISMMATLGSRAHDLAVMLEALRVITFIHAGCVESRAAVPGGGSTALLATASALESRIRTVIVEMRQHMDSARTVLDGDLGSAVLLHQYDQACSALQRATCEALQTLDGLGELTESVFALERPVEPAERLVAIAEVRQLMDKLRQRSGA